MLDNIQYKSFHIYFVSFFSVIVILTLMKEIQYPGILFFGVSCLIVSIGSLIHMEHIKENHADKKSRYGDDIKDFLHDRRANYIWTSVILIIFLICLIIYTKSL